MCEVTNAAYVERINNLERELAITQAKLRGAEHYFERLKLCPDHRDKTGDYCIVCQAEKRTKEEARLEAKRIAYNNYYDA